MANYTQIKVSVQPEIAANFRAKCLDEGVSMASEISRFMSGKEMRKTDPCSTRQRRRKAVVAGIGHLETICDAEIAYLENIPANLQNSVVYEAAEQAVSAMEAALNSLHGAY
jgi:hypothetical protein